MDYALMGDEGTLAVLSLCVGQETTPRMLMSEVLRAESSVELAASILANLQMATLTENVCFRLSVG